jgi:alpha-ketoglutarate-dependent taurine dioxygenase
MAVSRRGVVFFRSQDNLTNDHQKELIDRLGKMAGKPAANTLHIHPVLNNTSEFGIDDPQTSHISTAFQKHVFEIQRKLGRPKRYDAAKWHSDIQFEQHPADYTSLRLTDVPTTGGDTLWVCSIRAVLKTLPGVLRDTYCNVRRRGLHLGSKGVP